MAEYLPSDPEANASIILFARHAPVQPARRIVASGNVREMQVNRKPVALIDGQWDPATPEAAESSPSWRRGRLTLTWVQEEDGTFYSLEAGDDIPLEDLVRMIETIR